MIILKNLIKEIEEGIEDIQFVSPDETDIDYYTDLNQIERESGIHVFRWKHLVILAIKNEKCVGALYEGTTDNIYSFDVVVDKKERQQGIGAKLIDIGLSDFKSLPDEYKLVLKVVNAHLIPHLQKRGLRIVGKESGHIIMTY